MNTQYKKGVLELCVLSLLHKRDCYGYEISDFLSQHIDIADGTVYPILRKLKSDGLLTTYLQEESGGPPRKYYKLTELGRETYQNDRAEYLNFPQGKPGVRPRQYGTRKNCGESVLPCKFRMQGFLPQILNRSYLKNRCTITGGAYHSVRRVAWRVRNS